MYYSIATISEHFICRVSRVTTEDDNLCLDAHQTRSKQKAIQILWKQFPAQKTFAKQNLQLKQLPRHSALFVCGCWMKARFNIAYHNAANIHPSINQIAMVSVASTITILHSVSHSRVTLLYIAFSIWLHINKCMLNVFYSLLHLFFQ